MVGAHRFSGAAAWLPRQRRKRGAASKIRKTDSLTASLADASGRFKLATPRHIKGTLILFFAAQANEASGYPTLQE